jgi:pimeloyl-ACP methyl ester carboxylesterase
MSIKKLRKYGTSPYKVVAVHGGPGSTGSLAFFAKEIAKNCGVIEPLQTAETLQGQIEELKEVLEKHAVLPVTLIGHSWGAMLSYLFAATYPFYIRKLIMIGSGVFDEKYSKNIMPTRLNRLSKQKQFEVEQLFSALNNKDPQTEFAFQRLGKIFKKTDAFDPIELCETEIFSGQSYIYQNV